MDRRIEGWAKSSKNVTEVLYAKELPCFPIYVGRRPLSVQHAPVTLLVTGATCVQKICQWQRFAEMKGRIALSWSPAIKMKLSPLEGLGT